MTKEQYEKKLQKIKEANERKIKRLQKSRALQVGKAKQPTLAEHKRKLQKLVNAYVRQRDIREPCISCRKPCPDGHAGHYIAQGWSGALRFNLDNIHKQCVNCNVFRRGNLIDYRINLVRKIGEDKVKYLEDHRHDIKKWTHQELDQIAESLK